MKFDRLVVESGTHRTTLDLHPRLTVVPGVGPLEREGLVAEFVGALGSARSGIHLELTADSGQRFAVFRPVRAAHRVVDVDGRTDVTARFVDDAGRIDLLGRSGLDVREARRLMRIGAQWLAEASEGDRLVRVLATVDQQQLWTAAELLLNRRDRLDEEAAAAGTSAEDAEVVGEIERRHTEFERSQEQNEAVRRVTFVVAGLAALAAVPLAARHGSGVVAPLAALAAVAVGVSLVFWRRTGSARRREADALAVAGATSYLGFHLQRVNSLLSSDQSRRRLLRAAQEHREAHARWSALAGEVDVDWATSHRTEIAAAARVQMDVRPLGLATAAPDEVLTSVAQALLGRLADLRQVGDTGESFPLIVDEAFEHLDRTAVPALLELLVRGAAHQQVVVLTEDPGIESWARLESMTGSVGVAEVVLGARAA